ncbi:hypothetical protein PIROE2DRAFT_62092 [Piromyces sp. E2]|nr:hypothetical protein PIROE2DRAFT_62092 [Piromyces sp. E2]|eukprot:OUM62131.1 hypothetical protein PIROE2DRAFT_62092 [Piromyces sp. E2]
MNINYYLKSIIQFLLLISSVVGSPNYDKRNVTDTISSTSSNKKPTEWAVYLYDKTNGRYFTEEEVNRVAEEKDFVNLGKVGELEGYWLFRMKEGEPAEEYESMKETGLVDCQEDDETCHSQNEKIKKARNNIHKRTITEAEDDLSYLEDIHWFEKQKYVQRYKREFVAYSIHDFLNDGIGKSNVYDDNVRRKQFINSYKYDQQMNDHHHINKRSFYDKLRRSNLNNEKKKSRGVTFHDDYSDVTYDFDKLNFTDPFFHRQWHLVI